MRQKTAAAERRRRGGRPPGPVSTYDRRCTLYANADWWTFLSRERDRRRLAGERADWSSIVITGLDLLKRGALGSAPAAPAGGWASRRNCVRQIAVFLPRPWSTFLAHEVVRQKLDQTSVMVAGLVALRKQLGPAAEE